MGTAAPLGGGKDSQAALHRPPRLEDLVLNSLFHQITGRKLEAESLEARVDAVYTAAAQQNRIEVILGLRLAATLLSKLDPGKAIVQAVQMNCEEEQLTPLLNYWADTPIPAEGEFGLGHALYGAARQGYDQIVALILAHPSAKDIPATGDHSLGSTLIEAVIWGHLEIVVHILAHAVANAKDIPAIGQWGLGHALNVAAANRHPGIVAQILAHPSAKAIPATGDDDSLGSALPKAAMWGTPKIVAQILAHPNAKDIPAIGQWGLGHALNVAASQGAPKSVEQILAHAVANAKDIPTTGVYSLGSALRAGAKRGNPEIVAQILAHPNAKDIPAIGQWGLGDALCEAASQGDPKSVEQILAHAVANAKDIPPPGTDYNSLNSALFVATSKGFDQIAEIISSYKKAKGSLPPSGDRLAEAQTEAVQGDRSQLAEQIKPFRPSQLFSKFWHSLLEGKWKEALSFLWQWLRALLRFN